MMADLACSAVVQLAAAGRSGGALSQAQHVAAQRHGAVRVRRQGRSRPSTPQNVATLAYSCALAGIVQSRARISVCVFTIFVVMWCLPCAVQLQRAAGVCRGLHLEVSYHCHLCLRQLASCPILLHVRQIPGVVPAGTAAAAGLAWQRMDGNKTAHLSTF